MQTLQQPRLKSRDGVMTIDTLWSRLIYPNFRGRHGTCAGDLYQFWGVVERSPMTTFTFFDQSASPSVRDPNPSQDLHLTRICWDERVFGCSRGQTEAEGRPSQRAKEKEEKAGAFQTRWRRRVQTWTWVLFKSDPSPFQCHMHEQGSPQDNLSGDHTLAKVLSKCFKHEFQHCLPSVSGGWSRPLLTSVGRTLHEY